MTASIRRLPRTPGLDGVRALAIAAVMGLHAISRLFPGGYLGVDIFFVLSAFLITSLILAEISDTRGTYNYRAFYMRRALRLGPALIMFLALLAWPTAVLVGEAGGIAPWTIGTLLYAGNFLAVAQVGDGSAYAHVWSLAVEEQFYAVWPLLAVLLVRKIGTAIAAHPVVSATTITLLGVIATAASTAALGPSSYFLISGHTAPLAAGVAAAALNAWPSRKREVMFAHPAVGAVSLTVILILVLTAQGDSTLFTVFVQSLAAIAAAALVLHICEAGSSRVTRALSLKPALWIGQRSYGLYLYHRTVTVLLPALLPGLTLRWLGPLGIAAAVALAAVSFRFVEYPIIRLGRAAWVSSRGHNG